ncbi:MAG TPA: hypothetical protein VLJ11_13310 [Bryobacteraceae bacterium]|nr:hypothetical protein [Bryobacteraceae bacterium]
MRGSGREWVERENYRRGTVHPLQNSPAPVTSEAASFELGEGLLDVLHDPLPQCEEVKVYVEQFPGAQR